MAREMDYTSSLSPPDASDADSEQAPTPRDRRPIRLRRLEGAMPETHDGVVEVGSGDDVSMGNISRYLSRA